MVTNSKRHVNSLERSIITKSGYDNGWEAVVENNAERVVLSSALHKAQAIVTRPVPDWWFLSVKPLKLRRELERADDRQQLTREQFGVETEEQLGRLLRLAARLARSLPDAPEARYARIVSRELAAHDITRTEIERMVKQRVGQEIFRESLMDYWEGSCAVTGISVPELLRASHIKGWAECDSDSERLNVFNGFLLTAHLDALFDRHLMTFAANGIALFSDQVTGTVKTRLNLGGEVRLRWLSPDHEQFLALHRAAFEQKQQAPQASPRRQGNPL